MRLLLVVLHRAVVRRSVLASLSLFLTSACAADKVMHASAGNMVSRYVTHHTGSALQGCAAAVGIGVLKEVYDHHAGGNVEGADVLATGAGCTVSFSF